MSQYKNRDIRNLKDHQLENANVKERLRVVSRAENVLLGLDPGREYRTDDLLNQLTRNRPETRRANGRIRGREALKDLRRLVEDLSDSTDLSVEEAGEPVLTVEDVSERYNVSTKTVDRWRMRGLPGRRFRFGSRKRVGFLASTVEKFVERHSDEVRRGTRFSQMTDGERENILRDATELAREGESLSEISRRLAIKFERSAEAIRYTVKNHDRQNPENAVFPTGMLSLSETTKEDIYRKHQRGVSTQRLAREYCRPELAISRIVSEVRMKRLMDQPIEYMYHESFDDRRAEAEILGPEPEVPNKVRLPKAPPGLPPYLASLYEQPLLTKEQEAYFFRKMNFLKYKAARLRDKLQKGRPTAKEIDRVEELLKEANQIRNLLIRRNLRLVVSIAKKYIRMGVNFFEIVSDGNVSLMRAVDKFDYSRGFKFSTYATWAIKKNFARSIPAEHTYLGRFRSGSDEFFTDNKDDRSNPFEQERANDRQREVLARFLERLPERERDIIASRYGLERGTEPQTLEEVGQRFGVTKERIRQLEARALRRLREVAAEEPVEIPGV